MNVTKHVAHVLHSASLYPLSNFWGVTIAVILATDRGWISAGHAATIATVLVIALIVAASRRDDHRDTAALRAEVHHVTAVVDCQREGLEQRVAELIHALESAGLPVPPTRGEPHVR